MLLEVLSIARSRRAVQESSCFNLKWNWPALLLAYFTAPFLGGGGRVLSIKNKKNPFHTLRDLSLLKVRQIAVFQRTDIEMPIRSGFSARSTKRTPIVPIKADQSLLWPSIKTDPIEQFVVVIHQTQA